MKVYIVVKKKKDLSTADFFVNCFLNEKEAKKYLTSCTYFEYDYIYRIIEKDFPEYDLTKV